LVCFTFYFRDCLECSFLITIVVSFVDVRMIDGRNSDVSVKVFGIGIGSGLIRPKYCIQFAQSFRGQVMWRHFKEIQLTQKGLELQLPTQDFLFIETFPLWVIAVFFWKTCTSQKTDKNVANTKLCIKMEIFFRNFKGLDTWNF
jgi:hypothetical protein